MLYFLKSLRIFLVILSFCFMVGYGLDEYESVIIVFLLSFLSFFLSLGRRFFLVFMWKVLGM